MDTPRRRRSPRSANGLARAPLAQLVVLINGLLMMQLVTHSTAYGQDIGGLVTNLLEGHKHKMAAAAAA